MSDLNKGSVIKIIPDQMHMAKQFLKMFRAGKFGSVNLLGILLLTSLKYLKKLKA